MKQFANDLLVCSCGREFGQENALSIHRRTCKPSKKRKADIVEKARDILFAKKMRRRDESAQKQENITSACSNAPSALIITEPIQLVSLVISQVPFSPAQSYTQAVDIPADPVIANVDVCFQYILFRK